MYEKPRYYHIDFFRFVFAAVIVHFHVLHTNIMPYVEGIPLYQKLADLCQYSSNIVAAFFIISGVFMYRSYCAKPDVSIFDYLLGRAVRLWPLLVTAMLTESFLSGSFDWQNFTINSLFLQCSGLSLEYKGILWYISSFFFASMLLYALLASFSRRKALLIISLLTYFSLVFRINHYGGSIGGRQTLFNIFNLGVLRAVGDMGIGILLAEIYDHLHALKTVTGVNKWFIRGQRIIYAGIEIVGSFWLFRYFMFSKPISNHILLIIIVCAVLFCCLSSSSFLGLLFNHKHFGFLGKYAYAIYTMQQSSFYFLRKTVWLSSSFVAKPILALIFSTAFSILLGILAYHLIEKPSTSLYQKWYKIYMLKLSEEKK